MGNKTWGLCCALVALLSRSVRADTSPSPLTPPPPPPATTPPPAPLDRYAVGAPGVTAPTRSHASDGEVIGDFAAVGAVAAIDIAIRQDIDDGSSATLVMIAGTGGGAGLGYLLTQRYPVTAGGAHATTLGLLVGAANGALLIKPTGIDSSEGVLGLMLAGSAVGLAGGFAYGQRAELTAGQSWFVGNVTLLGSATAALGAITGSRNAQYDNWENGTLALGLDAGVVTGALLAPRLDWSARRGKVVFAATGVGALVGGMIAGLTTKKASADGTSDGRNPDLVTACMTAGLWGGFTLGILMTRDFAPDTSRSGSPHAGSPPTAIGPWIGGQREVGVMAGGSW